MLSNGMPTSRKEPLRAASHLAKVERRRDCPLSQTWSRGEAFGLESNLKIIHLGALVGHSVKAQRRRPKAKNYDQNIQTFIEN